MPCRFYFEFEKNNNKKKQNNFYDMHEHQWDWIKNTANITAGLTQEQLQASSILFLGQPEQGNSIPNFTEEAACDRQTTTPDGIFHIQSC